MDKLKYIKIENPDGSYSDSIPLAVDSNYVNVNGNTLTNELGLKATKTELNTLTSVVNTKVNPSDLQSVNNNLQSQINSLASGSPAGVYDTEEDLETADPDHSKIYVVSENGHWYYYNEEWTDGGVYQTAMIDMDDAMAHIRALEDNFDTDTTPNSNDFTLTDSASGFIPRDDEGKPKEMKIGENDIEQETTEGKNLFNGISDSITYYRNDLDTSSSLARNATISSVEIRGAGSGDGWSIRKLNFTGNKTYTLRTKVGTGSTPFFLIRLRKSDDSGWLASSDGVTIANFNYNATYKAFYKYGNSNIDNIITFTVPECLYFHIGFGNTSSSASEWLSFNNIQLEEGSSASDYEPYTGGQPSPSPDYPQDIHIVEGSSSIITSTKNEFDIGKEDDYIKVSNNGLTIIPSGSLDYVDFNINKFKMTITRYDTQGYYWIGKFINLKPNTAYTIFGEASKGIRIVGFNSIADNTVGTLIFSTFSNLQKTTFNSGNYKYYLFSIYPHSADTYINNIQIEQDSTINTYLLHKGKKFNITLPQDMFLGKIGTSLNYIYGTKDNWKLHSGIKKVVVDENDTIDLGTEKTITQIFNVNNKIVPLAAVSNLYYSNYFMRQEGDTEKIAILTNDTRIYVAMNKSKASTVTEFKNWLSNHNIIVYYPILTPTEINITDATLISQLNTIINELETYKGGTVVFTSGEDLAPNVQFDYMVNPLASIEARLSALEEEASI